MHMFYGYVSTSCWDMLCISSEFVFSCDFTLTGICDPHESSACDSVNDWEICTATEFECKALNQSGECRRHFN